MNRNNSILASITIFALFLSGFLFYQGLKDEIKNFLSEQVLQTSPEPEKQVLGEKNKLESTASTQSSQTAPKNQYKVSKVVDGDTIEVSINGENKKLRYIGVNTPETVDPRRPIQCFGKEASDENKRLLEGKFVILEKDVSETDKYDRLLRYVYLPLNDGTVLFVNDYLVRQGFAQSSSYPPDIKYQDRFNQAQKEARDNNRGLWASC